MLKNTSYRKRRLKKLALLITGLLLVTAFAEVILRVFLPQTTYQSLVFAYDFPGLLFKITDALFKCRLDVWIAKIATAVDQVVDIFYVRDFDGQKVDAPDQVSAIKKEIDEVLKLKSEGS